MGLAPFYVADNVHKKYYVLTIFVGFKSMPNITLQQISTLDAVVGQGSIQAAAKFLHKSHPSVIATLKKLEDTLGFALFDRAGYRSVLTAQGKAFHKNSRRVLADMQALQQHVLHLQGSAETELNIMIGDLTPLPSALKVLRRFSTAYPHTRLNLFFGNLFGPNERLLDGEADLMIHHLDKTDARYEYRDFCQVDVVPVVAPGFLQVPIGNKLRYDDLKNHTQCIIRDTATHSAKLTRFVLDDSPHITVGDQYTKKAVILQGMAWGHMPRFLIETELKRGTLLSIEGKFIKGIAREIVIARLSAHENGIMAQRLWQSF
jgi:DNA-binding transcriptional LysR family regulator